MTSRLERSALAAVALLALAAAPSATPTPRPRTHGLTLTRMRVAASLPLWFGGWRVAVPARAFPGATLSALAAQANQVEVPFVEASSAQPADDAAALTSRLSELRVGVAAFRIDVLPADLAGLRTLFEQARQLGATMVVVSAEADALPRLEAAANEAGVDVAVKSRKPIGLAEYGRRLGAYVDVDAWAAEGIAPADGLRRVKDRVIALGLRDHHRMEEALLEAYRLGPRPLLVVIEPTGSGDALADLAQSVDAFEKALQPAMAERVREVSRSPQGAIRGPDRVAAELRQSIEGAIPREAPARPKKPRKLLVFDLNMYAGHESIPYGNLMLERLGTQTGAYEAIFSNDLDNLKGDKIRQFDALFLNNVVGMVFPDPEVREGLLRYVREGGGLGGLHGTSYAALDWPEFAEMLGAGSGPHRVETQTLKIDDPKSPLTAPFAGAGFEHRDEFYHFLPGGPYSREKLHVLLSIDVAKSDLAWSEKPDCIECARPDRDYAVSWIKSYGKGRVFFTPLGHTPALFTSAPLVRHVLAGVQFILGDLEADTTPSASKR
jgi:type 1 glutamine amidotransferase